MSAFLFSVCLCILSMQAAGQENMRKPRNFPPNIPVKRGTYENWSTERVVRNLWIATPSNSNDVVTLVNWALANKYIIRPSGYMHSWSPVTVTDQITQPIDTVLVDTRKYLVKMRMTTSPVPSTKAVTVQTGASMLDLLTFLEENKCGISTVLAIGDATVGGVLAIGGHGSAMPAFGENSSPGHSYGTFSNLVISFTAVVWDQTSSKYTLKTFGRSDPDAKAFLINFGRTFLIEVTLIVGDNYNLRCQSYTDIGSNELFADPENVTSSTRTFSSFLNKTGRIEAIIFPFTDYPWLKVWSICPEKPPESRKVSAPFNYVFTDNFPKLVGSLFGDVVNTAWILNPTLGATQLLVTNDGLLATFTKDIWGPSKNVLLYVKSTTLRTAEMGIVITTSRSNVQKVIYTIITYYNKVVRDFEKKLKYPLNAPVEIRATLLDHPEIVPNSEVPAFSQIHPVENHPEFDVGVWFSISYFPGASDAFEALKLIQSFIYNTFDGTYAVAKVEWSKEWAFDSNCAWCNKTVLSNLVPASFPATGNTSGWNWAISVLDKYDPNFIFTNSFLNQFLVKVT